MMTQFQDNGDQAKAPRAAHLASGRPRYSVSWYEAGARSEHWTNDRDEAVVEHGVVAARAEVTHVLTFDNLALDMVAMHFISDARSYEEIAADADAVIDVIRSVVGGGIGEGACPFLLRRRPRPGGPS